MPKQDEGERLKRKGMARSSAAAPEQWKSDMFECVKTVCQITPGGFTADDVFDLADKFGIVPHSENRAFGAIIVRAAKEGLCHKTTVFPETRCSVRPELHRSPLQIWVSDIYDPSA